MPQNVRNSLFVIGINQYQSSKIRNLTNAVNDAEAISQVLQDMYGFDNVVFLDNEKATRTNVMAQLKAYFNELGQNNEIRDNLLVYFAGHGYYDKTYSLGYLIPFDGQIDDNNTLHNCIQNEELIKMLSPIKLHQLLVVSDSCFSGGLLMDSTRKIGDFEDNSDNSLELAKRLNDKNSRWIIASALLTHASDGGFYAQNSPFTKCFVDILRKNELKYFTSKRLLLELEETVTQENTQTPVGGSWKYQDDAIDLGSAFVFTLNLNKDIKRHFEACETKEDFEKFIANFPKNESLDFHKKACENIDWFIAGEKDTVESYNNFISKYPKSIFTIKALEKIDELDWDIAKDFAVDAFLHYIKKHKKGKFVKPANELIPIISQIENSLFLHNLTLNNEKPKIALEFSNNSILDFSNYEYPVLPLLDSYEDQKIEVDRSELEILKDKVVETLFNYKIELSKIRATVGQSIIFIEFVLDPSMLISTVKKFEDEMVFQFGTVGIRMIIPIPNRDTIGLEIPNKNRGIVSLREVLSSKTFRQSKLDLPLALGKDVNNTDFIFDLTETPHLLIGSSINQGKSVCINTILCSLLFTKNPTQLRIVLIDTKKIEFQPFSKLNSHFFAFLSNQFETIITDASSALEILNSLSIEMDKRYELLKNTQTHSIKEYNNKLKGNKTNKEYSHELIPYIVFVVNEFADLTTISNDTFESSISKLTQLAHIVGIHLIIATERPLATIITEKLKTNFNTRIALKVNSKTTSKIILDSFGAEQLIGQGDMLFSSASVITRVQGAFVSTSDVERVVGFISDQLI